MKKKLLLALALLLSSLNAHAFSSTPYLGTLFIERDLTSPDANYRGVHMDLSVGYMALFEYYYLAGELFASPFMITYMDNHPYRQDSLKVSRQYGGSINPGILVTEDLIAYLRLGVVRSTFHDPNNIVTGWVGGLGLQATLSSAWSIRGEYIYTDYSNIPGIGVPRSDEIGLGLVFKFDN